MINTMRKDVLFVLSVDTEEEWDWSGRFPQDNCSVENIQRLPEFHQFCQELGIRPTYFVDYAVASDSAAASRLKDIFAQQDSELGAHLHSWCNPPYYGVTEEFESHLINLPEAQIAAKMDALLSLLTQQFAIKPTSFRSGRWGVDGKVLQVLRERGIQVDSSVYPFYQNNFFSCEPCSLSPYWPDWQQPLEFGAQRELLELPVSVGFNRNNYELSEKIYRAIAKPTLERYRLVGACWQLKLLRKIYLSPELSSASDMISLTKTLLAQDRPVLHMYLHSSSLIDGATGLMTSKNSLDKICQRIKAVVEHLQLQVNVNFCTLSEASQILKVRNENGES